MVIRKGEDWGRSGTLPVDAPICADDGALAAALWVPARDRTAVAGLTGGDLYRTVGGTARGDLRVRPATILPIDVGVAHLDDGPHPFVAHVVVRGRSWFGDAQVVIMNAAWIGEWNLAPASHPNDGKLSVIAGGLPRNQRRLALERARSGTHLPHPALLTRRVDTYDVTVGARQRVWIDGRAFRSQRVHVELTPDAAEIVI